VLAVSFQNIMRLMTVKTGKSMLQGKFTDEHKKRDKAYNNGKKNVFYMEPFIPVILLQ
jgi:hypothetical protein